MASLKITPSVASVLREFLEDPTVELYGFDLMKRASISSGSLYPILIRLERAGWLVSRTEDIDPAEEGRPARKNYTLTPTGVTAAREALRDFNTRLEKLTARLRLPVPDNFGPAAAGGFA